MKSTAALKRVLSIRVRSVINFPATKASLAITASALETPSMSALSAWANRGARSFAAKAEIENDSSNSIF